MVDGWASRGDDDQRDGFSVSSRNISNDGMMLNCLEGAAARLRTGERLHIVLSDPTDGGPVDLFGRVAWKGPSIWESQTLHRQGATQEAQWRFAVIFEDTSVTSVHRLIYRNVEDSPGGQRGAPAEN